METSLKADKVLEAGLLEKGQGCLWKPVGGKMGAPRCSPVVASLPETSAAALAPSAKGVGGRAWRWGCGGGAAEPVLWEVDSFGELTYLHPCHVLPSSTTNFCNSQKVISGRPAPHGSYEQANFKAQFELSQLAPAACWINCQPQSEADRTHPHPNLQRANSILGGPKQGNLSS